MDSINCTYVKTIYRNEKTDYTCFSVFARGFDKYRNRHGDLICIGTIPILTQNVPLRLDGEFVKHKDDFCFEVNSYEIASDERKSMIDYLAENFTGIGEKLAEKIIDVTGPDIFGFVESCNGVVEFLSDNVKGLSKKAAEIFVNQITQSVMQKQVYDFLSPYGGVFADGVRCCEVLGTKAVEELSQNSYVAGELAGLPFYMCDAIARTYGGTAYNERRLESLVKYALYTHSDNGHMFASIDELHKVVNIVIKNSAFHDTIPKSLILRAAYNSPQIIVELDECNDVGVYSLSLWKNEESIIKDISRLENEQRTLPFYDEVVSEVENALQITYATQQKSSFDFLRSSGIKILTGGPGTGKTTVINGLIEAYKRICPYGKIKLCAPTGRAAQKMAEATGMEASTVHHLLEFTPFNNEMTCKNRYNPIDADFIIMDETSMTDTQLFSLFINAIKSNALVVLVGDTDQLPSVGAGKILNDFIKSNRFPVVVLDVIYRQRGGSNIIENAIKIKDGNTDLKLTNNFTVIKLTEEDDINEVVLCLAQKYYRKNNPYKCQFLSSTKQTAYGTVQLNHTLQKACNHNYKYVNYGYMKYKLGDKIMMIRNNYEHGYVNGDIGTIAEVSFGKITVDINGDLIPITNDMLEDMTLAYATTIHKSQGSEYDTVIVVLPSTPSNMLKRNLIYTAVTRAKKNVIIITQDNALKSAIQTIDITTRQSRLYKKLLKQKFTICKA